MSDKYKLTSKRNKRTGRMVYFAVTTAPSGSQSWRIVKKDFYKKYK